MSTLTVSPEVVRASPTYDVASLPGWACDVLSFISAAGRGGESVRLHSLVETLTPAEVAERIGLSRATISRRIASGEIRAIQVGNRHRIPVTEYERFRMKLLGEIGEHYATDIETDLFG